MADEDILARFERGGGSTPAKPQQPAVLATAEGELPEYVAYDTQDKLVTIDIIRSTKASRCPMLRNYLDIGYFPWIKTNLTLFFTYMTVKVDGDNLTEIIDAFRFGKCTAIRQYSPRLYLPPEEGKPIINRIEITAIPLREMQELLDREEPPGP